MAGEPSQEQIDQIVNALASGRKMEAIKILCDSTGKGLKEAKEFIDALVAKREKLDPEKYAGVSTADGLTQEQMNKMVMAIASGRQIEAVKVYHEATGHGLKESKEFVDALVAKLKK